MGENSRLFIGKMKADNYLELFYAETGDNRLSEQTQKIVCAHELGHDQRHRALAKNDALKMAHLNQLGYDLRPIEHRNDFLK